MKLTLHGERGPWVVKLSGIAGGVRLYEEEIAAAVAGGYRVAALDTTGDRRDDPLLEPLTWDRLSLEVVQAIGEVGAERAIVWGTSFGCLIALAAAVRHPSRISGLLLCHPPDPWHPLPAYVRTLDWTERRKQPETAARWLFTLGFYGMTAWEGLSPATWIRLPHLLRGALEAGTPPRTVYEKLHLLLRVDPGVPPEATPVEIVAGAWDLVAPPAASRRVAARMPRARVSVLGYSGHAGAYARPRAYHRVVTECLARLS